METSQKGPKDADNMCMVQQCTVYLHIMGNTVPDNKNNHSYSEIWRALPPIRTHTGRQKLPSSCFTLWKTLLPIMASGRDVCMDQGTAADTGVLGTLSRV